MPHITTIGGDIEQVRGREVGVACGSTDVPHAVLYVFASLHLDWDVQGPSHAGIFNQSLYIGSGMAGNLREIISNCNL
jgi:hypothetical protein